MPVPHRASWLDAEATPRAPAAAMGNRAFPRPAGDMPPPPLRRSNFVQASLASLAPAVATKPTASMPAAIPSISDRSLPTAVPAATLPALGSAVEDSILALAARGRMDARIAAAKRQGLGCLAGWVGLWLLRALIVPSWTGELVFLRYIALAYTTACLIQGTVLAWEYLVRPHDFDRVAESVAKLTPEQRKLYNLDPAYMHLVDAVATRRPTTTPIKPAKPLADIKSFNPLVTPRTSATTRIHIKEPQFVQPTPASVTATSDIRYEAANAFMRDERAAEVATAAASAAEASAASQVRGAGGRRSTSSAPVPSAAPPLSIAVKPVFQTYQMSSLPLPGETVVEGAQPITVCDADDTMREFGVDEVDLALWIENLREWLADKVFKPIVADMKRIDAFLEEKRWAHLALANSVPATDPAPVIAPTAVGGFGGGGFGGFGFNQTKQPFGGFGGGGAAIGGFGQPAAPTGPPKSFTALAQYSGENVCARLRIQYERYLYMSVYPGTRAYILRRLEELAQGTALAAYRWNTGGFLDSGKPWSTSAPSDAELVMHVLSTWFDFHWPTSGPLDAGAAPFSSVYVRVEQEEKPDLADIHLVLAKRVPPHFTLGSVKSRIVYEVFEKRSNLFAVLVLFIHKINKENDGFIGNLNVGDDRIGLTAIFDTRD